MWGTTRTRRSASSPARESKWTLRSAAAPPRALSPRRPTSPGALFSWSSAASRLVPSLPQPPPGSAVIELTAWTHHRPHSTTGKTHTHAHALLSPASPAPSLKLHAAGLRAGAKKQTWGRPGQRQPYTPRLINPPVRARRGVFSVRFPPRTLPRGQVFLPTRSAREVVFLATPPLPRSMGPPLTGVEIELNLNPGFETSSPQAC